MSVEKAVLRACGPVKSKGKIAASAPPVDLPDSTRYALLKEQTELQIALERLETIEEFDEYCGSRLPVWSSAPSGRKDKFVKRPDPMKPKPGTLKMSTFAGQLDESDPKSVALFKLKCKFFELVESCETPEEFNAAIKNALRRSGLLDDRQIRILERQQR